MKGVMNALLAAPLGVAAAVIGATVDATAQAAELPPPEPVAPPAVELAAAPVAAPQPTPDVLDPDAPEGSAGSEAAAPVELCDEKCKFISLTETILPNTGVADLVSVALEPDKHTLDIPTADGDPALSIKIDPTKVQRGKAVVLTAKF
jgi:hypothetical protein